MQLVPVFFQQTFSTLIVTIDNGANLGINGMRGFVRHILVLRNRPTEEHFTFFLAVGQRPQAFGKPPLGDHVARQLGGTLNVVGGAGCHHVFTKDQHLGDTPAKQTGNLAFQPLFAKAVTVFLGQEHGDTQRTTTRDDTDLVNRVMRRHQSSDNGVSGLMVRGEFLFFLTHHHGLALGTHHDLVLGFFQVIHVDQAFVGTRGKQRGLVHQVGQVSSGKPGGAAGDNTWLDIIPRWHLAQVHLENLLTTTHIRQRYDHLPVKTARTQQSGIQHIRPVSRSNDDDALVTFKTVHLDQQLVEGLLALIVTAAETRTAMTTDRIDFVDKDNARCMLLGLLEHVAHARCANAHEHLDKVRT